MGFGTAKMFVLFQPALFSSGKHERHLHTANRAEVEIQTLRAQGVLGWCGLVVMYSKDPGILHFPHSVPSRAPPLSKYTPCCQLIFRESC